jgi:hypothetical protein
MMFIKVVGGSSLDSKGLVDTGKQIKNRDSDSQQWILVIQVL